MGNCITGCTQMLNRKCYRGVGEFHESITYHDWWVSLYASIFGVIVRVPMALILYRQHSDNVAGAGKDVRTQRNVRYYLRKMYEYIRNPMYKISTRITDMMKYHSDRYASAHMIFSMYHDKMPPEKLRELDEYFDMFGKSIFTRTKALRKFMSSYG